MCYGEWATCHHKNSILIEETPFQKIKRLATCSERNKNNNCKDFEQRYEKGTKIIKEFFGIPLKREYILKPIIME